MVAHHDCPHRFRPMGLGARVPPGKVAPRPSPRSSLRRVLTPQEHDAESYSTASPRVGQGHDRKRTQGHLVAARTFSGRDRARQRHLKDRLVRISSTFALTGTVFLAAAICGSVTLVTSLLFGTTTAAVIPQNGSARNAVEPRDPQ